MNVNTIFSVPTGRTVVDPRTGASLPTKVVIFECLDAAEDHRSYSVEEHGGAAGIVRVRRREFTSFGYFGAKGNLCGDRESKEAFALAREWVKTAA